MPSTTKPKTARRGTPQWLSLDPMSRVRLDYLKHVAHHSFDAEATNSTIVRRALAVYLEHVESVMPFEGRGKWERLELIAANRGDTFTIPEPLIKAVPVRFLSAIKKEYAKVMPSATDALDRALDQIERDREAE